MSNERIVSGRFEQIGLACCREEVRACLEQAEKQTLVELSKIDDLVVVFGVLHEVERLDMRDDRQIVVVLSGEHRR